MSLDLSPEAHARLNDKKWRRAQSKWMLWIYLTHSLLGAVGFARLAIKTKNENLKKYAYIASGLMFLIFVLISIDDSTTTQVDGQEVTEFGVLGNIAMGVWIVNYALLVYLSFKANKIWLVFKAKNNNPTWTSENLNVKDVAQKAFAAPHELVKDALGINQEEFFASPSTPAATNSERISTPPPPPLQKKTPPPPPGNSIRKNVTGALIDLNSATVEQLMREGGLDPVLAANTVVQREKRGGFSSFEDFANAMSLQPHQVAKLKPLFNVDKKNDSGGNTGRVLDI